MSSAKKDQHKVAEAQLEYVATKPRMVYPEYATTRLSGKNQLTLPVAMVRDLGLTPGDELNVWLEKDHIVIEKRLYGAELLDSLQGCMKGGEWSTREGVQTWLRRERDSWEREWDEPNS